MHEAKETVRSSAADDASAERSLFCGSEKGEGRARE